MVPEARRPRFHSLDSLNSYARLFGKNLAEPAEEFTVQHTIEPHHRDLRSRAALA